MNRSPRKATLPAVASWGEVPFDAMREPDECMPFQPTGVALSHGVRIVTMNLGAPCTHGARRRVELCGFLPHTSKI
eukprot:6442321-Amphidinium_carterae.1